MSARGNRTVICSVVFIDIVEYSKKSVADQMRTKEIFNGLLSRALTDVPDNDRIILDTGDGAAISFLGDPEEALFLVLALRDALAESNGSDADDTLPLRIGINLGPVRLVKDINGQPNIIGDGINVAQRIMTFADVRQVLASRSYYEVVSALSPDYAHLFKFEGARTDKHVREHEVYALGDEPAPERTPRKNPGAAAKHAGAAIRKIDAATSTAWAHLLRRPPLATGLAVAAILAVAVALRLTLMATDPEMATYPEPPAPVAGKPAAKMPVRATPPPAPPAAPVVEPEPPKARVERKPAPPPRAREEAPVAVATGILRLQIVPWGDVYVDGDKFGTAPPMRDVALKPGRHRIEIRNPGFASYVQFVEIRAGEETRIRHRFQ